MALRGSESQSRQGMAGSTATRRPSSVTPPNSWPSTKARVTRTLPDATFREPVEVRAAQADRAHAHEHLARPGPRPLLVVEPEVPLP